MRVKPIGGSSRATRVEAKRAERPEPAPIQTRDATRRAIGQGLDRSWRKRAERAAAPEPARIPLGDRFTYPWTEGLHASGFSLLELMVAMVICAVLVAVAYPSYELHVLRTRRAEAVLPLFELQLAQERWRANNASYATLSELNGVGIVGGVTSEARYKISISNNTATSYSLHAAAIGDQAHDTSCAFFTLQIAGGNTVLRSGPTAETANEQTPNRRCWSQ
jgi:type IV pilus assembly protein PilE